MSDESLPQRERRVRKRRRNPHGQSGAAEQGPKYVRVGAIPVVQFEYLDHTADIQIHSWGSSLEDAFAHAAIAMYNYMTPLDFLEEQDDVTIGGEVKGHDVQSLLYNFLHELIFVFSTEDVVCKSLRVSELRIADGDASLRYEGRGDKFSLEKHPQGTEIKAVTYSNMQVLSRSDADRARVQAEGAQGDGGAQAEWHVYVIVDI